MNVLDTAELLTSNGLILCYMNFTSIKNKTKQNYGPGTNKGQGRHCTQSLETLPQLRELKRTRETEAHLHPTYSADTHLLRADHVAGPFEAPGIWWGTRQSLSSGARISGPGLPLLLAWFPA